MRPLKSPFPIVTALTLIFFVSCQSVSEWGSKSKISLAEEKKMAKLMCPVMAKESKKDKLIDSRGDPKNPPSETDLKKGGLTAREIMTVMRENLNEIRHCYEKSLKRRPQLSGKLGVSFIISLEGEVTNSCALPYSDIMDARLWSCALGAINAWKFPKPRGEQHVTVNYPFTFRPKD